MQFPPNEVFNPNILNYAAISWWLSLDGGVLEESGGERDESPAVWWRHLIGGAKVKMLSESFTFNTIAMTSIKHWK